MKSVFITFDQAFYERILALLDRQNCRGFSYWQQVQGRGSVKGEPHYGSHAWPSMCSAIITVVDDEKVDSLLDALHKMDKETEQISIEGGVKSNLCYHITFDTLPFSVLLPPLCFSYAPLYLLYVVF